MSKNRCQYQIIDSKRKCKNHIYSDHYCKVHYDIINKQQHDQSISTIEIDTVNDETNDINNESEYGTCCFCGEYCNPCSQSCGRCARQMTMKMSGWT